MVSLSNDWKPRQFDCEQDSRDKTIATLTKSIDSLTERNAALLDDQAWHKLEVVAAMVFGAAMMAMVWMAYGAWPF